MNGIHVCRIEVRPEAIDPNGHANNVEFVRWMQDAAVEHSDVTGCTAATRAIGAMWVARTHRITYLRSAMVGDCLAVQTWVADFRRAFSLRKYRVLRPADGTVLAEGETDWVFVDSRTGRPRSVPPEIQGMFQLLPDGPEGVGKERRRRDAGKRGRGETEGLRTGD